MANPPTHPIVAVLLDAWGDLDRGDEVDDYPGPLARLLEADGG